MRNQKKLANETMALLVLRSHSHLKNDFYQTDIVIVRTKRQKTHSKSHKK